MTSSSSVRVLGICGIVLCLSACGSPTGEREPDGGATSDEDSGASVDDDAGTSIDDDAGTSVDDDGGGGDPDAQVMGDAGPPPSAELVALYENVLMRSCGGSSCHIDGGDGRPFFGYLPHLRMPDPATARAMLVNRTMECIHNPADVRVRVVPGDPAASSIMTVNEDGLCGTRHNNALPAAWSDADLAMIEAWIAGGAL